jgi:hypothetical protein
LIDAKFPEAVIRWISSYLRNRTGKISINNVLSRAFPLLAGVPQGSSLAPLLYIFFTRLMPTQVHRQILNSFYADDTCFAVSDSKVTKLTVQDLLQPILTKLEAFCSDWRMGINPTKTWCLNFYNKNGNNNSPRLWLMGELVNYHKMGKFLGVTLDSPMTFEPHVCDISARCRK